MSGSVDDGLWTPARVEQELSRLHNAIAQAEMENRRMLDAEFDAKRDYERALIQANFAADAPVVERGGATVADKDMWLRKRTFDQKMALMAAELAVRKSSEYMRRLDKQISIVQTKARMVLSVYQNAGVGQR